MGEKMERKSGIIGLLARHVEEHIRSERQWLTRRVSDDAKREQRNPASLTFRRDHFGLHINGGCAAGLSNGGSFR